MAATLHTWFREIHTGSDIQETLKRCERPENCECLKVVKINDEIKAKMQKPDEIKDQRLKWICQSAPKAAWPLATVWSELSRIQFFLQQNQPPEEEVTNAILQLGKDEPPADITDLIDKVELSLKIIGITSVQALHKRRHDLQYKLAGPAKQLAEFNHKFTDEMFGPTMKSDVANIVAMNKLTRKLTSPSKNQRFSPFLGKRGHGRGRGQHFNQHQGPPPQNYNQGFNQNNYGAPYYNQYQTQYPQGNQGWGSQQQQNQPRQQPPQNQRGRGGRGAHNSPKK